jgi:hypothetical protein
MPRPRQRVCLQEGLKLGLNQSASPRLQGLRCYGKIAAFSSTCEPSSSLGGLHIRDIGSLAEWKQHQLAPNRRSCERNGP